MRGAAPRGLALVLGVGLLRVADGTCTAAQWATETCPWAADGECDVPTHCSSGDCVDCDPCSVGRLGWVGCSGCAAAGCHWCEASRACMSDATACPSTTDCSSADRTVAGQVFTDPAAIHQAWWLEAINVGPAWAQGITGAGVNIFFQDDALDYNHPDFSSKYNPAGSVGDPLPQSPGDTHGTFVASYAAAAANNGVCGVGVAYGATVSASTFRAGPVVAFEVGVTNGVNHVHSNSWGIDSCREGMVTASAACPFNRELQESPCNHADCASQDWGPEVDQSGACLLRVRRYCGTYGDSGGNAGVYDAACADFWDLWVTCGHQALSNQFTGLLRAGVTDGRNGKGIVYTFAAGNEFGYGDNVNFEGWLNSIYTIAVGALDEGLKHAFYSSAGAPLFISAPGGEQGNGAMIGALATAAGMGANGQQCQNGGQGTSYSCPVVSGVVALMLEANSDLHWRDVQDILARTAVKVDPADASWATNGAGLHHSDLYGFGLVDAGAAVAMAQAWTAADTKAHAVVATPVTVNMAIPDGGAGVSCAVEVTPSRADIVESVEHVVVYVSTSGHTNRGDLELVLTSPAGTRSVLAWQHNEPNDDYSNWKFMTVRNWGEPAAGVWEFAVRDAEGNGVEGTLDSWILAIYGKCTTTGDGCLRIVQPEFMSSLCDDSCWWANDQTCSDGGPGSGFAACKFGTDCSDCGVHFFDAAASDPMALSSVSYTCMTSSGGGTANATTTAAPTTSEAAPAGNETGGASAACPPGTAIHYFWPYWITLGAYRTSRVDCDWNAGTPATCSTYPRVGGTAQFPVWGTVSDGTVPCAGLGDYCWYAMSVASGPSYEDNYTDDAGYVVPAEMTFRAADGLACNAYSSAGGGSTPLCTTQEYSCDPGYQLRAGEVAGTGAGACQRRFCDQAVFTAGCCEATIAITTAIAGSTAAATAVTTTVAAPTTAATANTTTTAIATPPTCTEAQWAAESCRWASDGRCDVPAYCSSGDCMDCDPCSVLRLGWVGCGGCAAAGCHWCEASRACMSDATGCSSTTNCSSADQAVAGQVFTDPAAIHQAWWLEAINVGPVWAQGITGAGVNIFFHDDALDYNHPDFSSKYNPAGSVGDPLPWYSSDTHGTFVASYAAAAANNSVCGVGVAYGANVSAAAFRKGPTAAFTVGVTDGVNHVHSNSWGIDSCRQVPGAAAACPFNRVLPDSPCNHADCANWGPEVEDQSSACTTRVRSYCGTHGDSGSNDGVYDAACADMWDLWVVCAHQALSNEFTGLLRAGVTDGRSGKGIVYTFAAGNEFVYGDNVNFEGWLNSIYTIAVGALDVGLRHASYSSAGAPVLVSAPGGEQGNGAMIGALATAAGMGANGQQCQSSGPGTGYACPVVSGVVALMLEANSDLHWRDVQDILARTSMKVDTGDASWATNGAGLHHSYLYGFGLVDAGAAVAMAQAWTAADTKAHAVVATPVTVNMAIPHGGTGVSCAVEVTSSRADVMESVEHVVVYVSTSGHTHRGDLELVLTSPSGTSSVLAWQHNEPNDDYSNWKFMTVRNWGESAAGMWEFTVRDARDNDVEGTLDSWILAIYGKCTTTGDGCLRIVQPEFMSSLCDDSCWWANDQSCDDGGPGSADHACTFGTDCSDCGVHFFDAASNDPMALSSVSYTCMSSSGAAANATTVTATTTSEAAPAGNETGNASVACPPGTPIHYFWPHWVALGAYSTARVDCQWGGGSPGRCPRYPRIGGTALSPIWGAVPDGTVPCAGLGDYCWYDASVKSGPSHEGHYTDDAGYLVPAEMTLRAADGLACNAYSSAGGGGTPLCTAQEYSCAPGYQLRAGEVAGTGANACQRKFCDQAVFTAGCCEAMTMNATTATTSTTKAGMTINMTTTTATTPAIFTMTQTEDLVDAARPPGALLGCLLWPVLAYLGGGRVNRG